MSLKLMKWWFERFIRCVISLDREGTGIGISWYGQATVDSSIYRRF